MMQGKVAIVTGGGRGIGKGISHRLATDGMAVAVIYHQCFQAAEETVTEIEARNGHARAYQADVADRRNVHRMISEVLRDFERIDILVNNAGITTESTTVELSEASWDRIINVNLKGTFLCSQAVIPHMRASGSGRIINLSSIAGQTGGVIGPHYAASKAGIIGLTRFMARELGADGITVNAVAPSGVPTELLFNLGMEPSADRPVQRTGTAEDVAAAVNFLASDAAGYITGQILGVNGGSFIG